MFLDESPLSLDLWLRTFGLSSLSSVYAQDITEDVLVPAFDSESRRGSPNISKAALLLTLVGNGILGLPYAFERCGVAVSIIVIVLLAILTDRTMYLLWMCSRKTGTNTYGGVVRIGFGHQAHCATSASLFLFLLIMVSQYITCELAIWKKLIQQQNLPYFWPGLLLALVAIAAAACNRDFHSLWLVVIVGVCSLFASLVLLCYKSNYDPTLYSETENNIKFIPDTLNDFMLGFNVLLLNAVASFNILYIHSELKTPTVTRMQQVVRQAVIGATFLSVTIGIAGYKFLHVDSEEIPINFLDHASLANNNLPIQLTTFIAILLGTPLILIPCRDYLLDTIETLVLDGHCPGDMSDCQDEIETWTTRSSTQGSARGFQNNLVIVDEQRRLLPVVIEEDTADTMCELNLNPYVRYGSIATILILGGLLASVNTVIPWLRQIVAPSMAVIIAFFLPAACYLKVRARESQTYNAFSHWVIALSAFLCLFCAVVGAGNSL